MIRPLLAALVLQATAASAAESLHLAPIGTVVTGSFDLAGKVIPLPRGNFALAAASVSEAPMGHGGDISKRRAELARVLLVQSEPPRLRAYVLASAVLPPPPGYAFHWTNRSCAREDRLYRADLWQNDLDNENCLVVDHSLANFGPRSKGMWQQAAAWLGEQGVQLPVPVLISAQLTRSQRWDLVTATYAFNPRMYGCDAPRSRSWADSPWHKKQLDADPQRVRFVDSVIGFGKALQPHFDGLVAGRKSAGVDKLPEIHSCTSAQAALN